MNYRHAYHAGNFADVLKHAVLALAIDYMKRKDKAFRVIDAHAGKGIYTFGSREAAKTGEWQDGIGRLCGKRACPLSSAAASELHPYFEVIHRQNPDGELTAYPGSSLLALRLMRRQDTLIANELHPEEVNELKRAIGNDRRAKVMNLDAAVALRALLPPRERRAVVLIDPPFEKDDEWERLIASLKETVKRFATGTYIAWYPIKNPKAIADFRRAIAALNAGKVLCVEVAVRRAIDAQRLNACGLIIVNPPHTLPGSLEIIMPEITRVLRQGDGARYRLEWVRPE